MSVSILLLNKYNIAKFRNTTNNGASDDNSGNDSDSNSDRNNEGDSYAKITHTQDDLGMLINYKTTK